MADNNKKFEKQLKEFQIYFEKEYEKRKTKNSDDTVLHKKILMEYYNKIDNESTSKIKIWAIYTKNGDHENPREF